MLGQNKKICNIKCCDLGKPEMVFLKNLDYWISRGEYGREYDGKIWIYNTLDQWAKQIGVSKSTFQRHIKKLRDAGLVETAYLSFNKRNRTLYYTINYEKLNQKIENDNEKRKLISKRSQVVKNKDFSNQDDQTVEHMGDHMNIHIHYQKIHKSWDNIPYKSGGIASHKNFSEKAFPTISSTKNLQEHNEEMISEVITKQIPKEKPHIIQDMVKSLTNIFPGLMKNFKLTKTICRNLVAAFQRKFHNSIKAWERYLKTIKTSTYLMSEKFKLSIYWILKFLTIDRILNGDFGVNPDNITLTDEEKQKKVEDKKQQIQQKIAEINESETCKQARVKVLETLGNSDYQQYFENPNKCRLITNNIGDITVELLGSAPWNFYVIKERLEKIGIKVEWISNEIKVEQENGYTAYCMAKSFEELETLSALYSPRKKKNREVPRDAKADNNVPETSFWKRAFKPKEQKQTSKPMTMEEEQQLFQKMEFTGFSLKVGILEEVLEKLQGKIPKHKIKDALKYYTRNLLYHQAVLINTHRIDLEGKRCQLITAQQKEYSQKGLGMILAKNQQMRKS